MWFSKKTNWYSRFFIFFYLDGIEALADDLTLNQDVFELCLAQLVNCSKIGQDEYQELLFFFVEKEASFACLVGSGLSDISN